MTKLNHKTEKELQLSFQNKYTFSFLGHAESDFVKNTDRNEKNKLTKGKIRESTRHVIFWW